MSIFEIFIFFCRISAVTFGGGVVILGMVQLEAEKRGDIPADELADMVSLAASMPGPMAVSISWLFGRRYHGAVGGLAGVLGAILPPFLTVLILTPIILKYSKVPQVEGFFRGVLAGTSAIITVVVVKNVKNALSSGWWNLVPFAVIIAMIGIFKIHPLIAIMLVIVLQLLREKAVSK
jgi:chromate transporter